MMAGYNPPKGTIPKALKERKRAQRRAAKAAKRAIRREAAVQPSAELDENGRNPPLS